MQSISQLRRTKGFTLVEILVSMVILAIGLLGLASMQLIALKDNQDAYLYSQATALASDMSDRVRVNASGWTGTLPTDAAATAATATCNNTCNAVASPCTPAQMALRDYCVWKNDAKDKIGTLTAATVQVSPVTGSTQCATTGGAARCITLTWTGSKQTTATFELEMYL